MRTAGSGWVVTLDEAGGADVALVGGKAAHLGEVARLDGVHVPPGFVVTTGAFRRAVAQVPGFADRLGALAAADPDDREALRALAAELRRTVGGLRVPGDCAAEVTRAVAAAGDGAAWAVRSSATAEDLPTASFAGQHDSYLDVVGADEVLRRVRRCWASLFTERAVAYRRRQGVDDRTVRMAVLVQRMVPADAAGVLFTADPLTGDRTVTSIEAVPGLGEALAAGRAGAQVLRVRDGRVVAREAAPGAPRAVLTDGQAVALAALGRRVAAHLGRPQDVEWCLAGDAFAVVQSRPVTTLYPVPAAADGARRVYLSVGHQQMMTDAMRTLGLSVWQRTALAPMVDAGGRLFVDVTRALSTPAGRAGLLASAGRADPLTRDALQCVVDRDIVPLTPGAQAGPPPHDGVPATVGTDPAVVAGLVERDRASLAALRRDLAAVSGPALFDALPAAFAEHRRILGDPLSMQAIMAGMQATWWLNDRLRQWLGEPDAAGPLTLAAPGDVTAEMGLALLDVADVVRPYPQVLAYLRDARDDGFLDGLAAVAGGDRAREALASFLDRYGMRCPGEIDITRPRWAERPTMLVPALLDHVRTFAPGEARRRVERGRERARRAAGEILARLRAQPDGAAKADETARMIERVRTFTGYREYPKYGIVSRYLVYKRALLAEADRLVRAGVLADAGDVFHLTLDEFADVSRTHRVDAGLVRRRRAEFRSYRALTPPRVLTSDGETFAGAYRRADVPAGALPGVPVSAGTVEGRARIVRDMAHAGLEPGDVLVTAHTDPGWTPLLVTAAALVTEVGGLMTHGAVIAREYGLPAVVGVVDATRAIADGQRIRVHGTAGYVELLP